MKNLIVVTGIPRSGTSMMMRILEFGGVSCVYEDIHKEADKIKMRNIYGFYEFGKIPVDANVAVKRFGHGITKLLSEQYNCYFIFMMRDVDQIHKSWLEVGNYRNNFLPPSYIERQNRNLEEVKKHKHIIINYDDAHLNSEETLLQLKAFLPMDFDTTKAIKAIDKSLYIKRG